MSDHTSYISKGFTSREKTLDELARLCVEKIGLSNFEGFVFTGLSGAIFGFSLADKLQKGFAYIRKAGDNTHSAHYRNESRIETNLPDCSRVVFFDDLVESGKTFSRVCNEIDGKFLLNKNAALLYGRIYEECRVENPENF